MIKNRRAQPVKAIDKSGLAQIRSARWLAKVVGQISTGMTVLKESL